MRYATFLGFALIAVAQMAGCLESNLNDATVSRATTSMISRSSSGAQGNSESSRPSISADGRRIAFQSSASNLIPGDANGNDDIFVRDLADGTLTLVSLNAAGTGTGNGASRRPILSPNGRFVVFQSFASNLVAWWNGSTLRMLP